MPVVSHAGHPNTATDDGPRGGYVNFRGDKEHSSVYGNVGNAWSAADFSFCRYGVMTGVDA